MNKSMTKQLVINALDMAAKNRKPSKELIFHSDQGSQYASHNFQRTLWKNGMRSSMNRKEDCWDNAVSKKGTGKKKYFSIY
jgi:putative transposase